MKKAALSVKSIYVILLIYTLAFWFSKELAKPAISIALADGDSSSSTIGFLLSMQNFLPLVLAVPMATMGDKFGHEKVLHLGSVLSVISGVCFLFTGAVEIVSAAYPALLTIGQIFSGIAWTVAWISLQALISDCDTVDKENEGQGKGVSRMILIMSIGMILGPLLAGEMIDLLGIYSVWILNMLLGLVQMGLSFMLLGGCRSLSFEQGKSGALLNGQEEKQNLLHQLGGGIYLVMVSFSFLMMFGSEIKGSYMSVILRGAGMESRMIGYIAAAGSLATCLIRIVMNLKPAAKIPGRVLIFSSMIFLIFAMAGFAFLPVGNLYLLPSVLIGLCGGLIEPVLIVYILEYALPERKGLALTGRVLFNRLAMFLAPSAAGLAVGSFGIKGGFEIITVMISMISFITIYGMTICFRRRKRL